MSLPRFVTNRDLTEGLQLQLEEGPSRHLAGALRLQAEAEITLFNGEGGEYRSRMDWVVHKATELGVATIGPLTSERTKVKLKAERAEKKYRHWQNIAISACEQCGRNRNRRTPGIFLTDAGAAGAAHENSGAGNTTTPLWRPDLNSGELT